MTINAVTATIAGNSGHDPELRHSSTGQPVASFSVAVTPRRKDERGQWGDGTPTWYRVSCFGNLAENVAGSVSKGDRVICTGTVELRPWTGKDGRERTSLELTAEDVALSMAFRTVKVGSERYEDDLPNERPPF